MEEVSIEQMQATLQDYIYDRKGIRVRIDIQAVPMLMPRRLGYNELIKQLKLLNIAYNEAEAYYMNH